MRPHHYLILALIALLLFGAQRLPDFARNLGQSLKILKKELHESGTHEAEQPAASENAAATSVTSQGAAATPATTRTSAVIPATLTKATPASHGAAATPSSPEPTAPSSPTNTAS